MPPHSDAHVRVFKGGVLSDTKGANLWRSGGISHLPDLLQQLREDISQARVDAKKQGSLPNDTNAIKHSFGALDSTDAAWRQAVQALTEPSQNLVAVVNEGLEHAGLQLGIIDKPKAHKVTDAESQGGLKRPGDLGFTARLERGVADFAQSRLKSLTPWTAISNLPRHEINPQRNDVDNAAYPQKSPSDRRQLNLILYTHSMVRKEQIDVLFSC